MTLGLILIAGVMGASGVILAAAAAHTIIDRPMYNAFKGSLSRIALARQALTVCKKLAPQPCFNASGLFPFMEFAREAGDLGVQFIDAITRMRRKIVTPTHR